MLKNKFYRSHKLLRNLKYNKSHKLPHNLNSQAALEFLVTYSWAFLSILITLGALYYFGIFDFGKFLPQKCLFTSQLECLDFVMKYDAVPANSEVRFKLVNNLGETINIDVGGVTLATDYGFQCTTAPTGQPGWDAVWNPSEEKEFLFTGCSGGGYLKKERVEAKVTLTYFAPATLPKTTHTVNGKIISVVT